MMTDILYAVAGLVLGGVLTMLFLRRPGGLGDLEALEAKHASELEAARMEAEQKARTEFKEMSAEVEKDAQLLRKKINDRERKLRKR